MTESNSDLVSICMPAYNAEKYIIDAVNSIIVQSYHNWELIIVNDGSNDKTLEVLKPFVDARIRVINKGNFGAAAARNTAFKNSKGGYIIFLDADDWLPSNFIESQVKALQASDDTVSIASWGRFFDDDLATFQQVETTKKFHNIRDWIVIYWYSAKPMTNPGRIMLPRKIAEKAGPWNERLSLNDDLEYFTRVFLASSKLYFNADTLFYYRSGINGLSSNRSFKGQQSLFDSLKLSIDKLLSSSDNDQKIRQSCANMWQSLIYELYPANSRLVKLAQFEVMNLGGSNLPFSAGGVTKILARIIGWKLTKKLKSAIKR